MQKVQLNDSLSLSRLVYGMWRLGDDTDASTGHVQAKIEACLAQGITTMDQADIYGDYGAEEILGNALKAAPALKDQIEIVTKCDIVAPCGRHSGARVKYYDTSATYSTQSVEDSLRLMNIDKIDLLLVHRPDPFMNHLETGKALDALVHECQVRRSTGCGNPFAGLLLAAPAVAHQLLRVAEPDLRRLLVQPVRTRTEPCTNAEPAPQVAGPVRRGRPRTHKL